MKAFLRGFWEGVKSTSLVVGGLCSFVGIIYCFIISFQYLINTFGDIGAIVLFAVAMIIAVGIIHGLWARYHYNKLKSYLDSLEQDKDTMR